jgi:hypothetical protein
MRETDIEKLRFGVATTNLVCHGQCRIDVTAGGTAGKQVFHVDLVVGNLQIATRWMDSSTQRTERGEAHPQGQSMT